MEPTLQPESSLEESRAARRLFRRYALLTVALAVPLVWAFATLRNAYPVAASNMMTNSNVLARGGNYFILRGETISGEVIDIRPSRLGGPMAARAWGMAAATVQNGSFRLASPHPDNARLMAEAGGFDNLPRAVRLPELLRAWGENYNARQPADSQRRLRAVRLDVYRWGGLTYGDYERFIETWRTEL